ncbi:hypothetical protein KAT95_01125 [Candidatus Parcubacteria bacterium]|nr:hypothetical protein [Candidatus Parcubacteria bacterium]
MEETNKKIEKAPGKEYREEVFPKETLEEREEILEKKELTEQEKEARKEIEKEIEKVKLSPQTKVQAQKQADDIKKGTVQGKIQHLLDLAQTQGLAYAVEVVRKMNDPYLLDLFHDTLAEEGRFKKFLEK